MPSTREIRRRIRSVKNTAQITKAMQMVASSKMRRAQERVQQSRPYADQLRELVSRLANAGGEDIGEGVALLKQRPVRNIGIVLLTPDRGLCGALPSNINRKAAATALEQQNALGAASWSGVCGRWSQGTRLHSTYPGASGCRVHQLWR